MDAPIPATPPSLGRQQDGAEGFVHLYGQNICPNIQPEPVRAWHPPLAPGWEPNPYSPAIGPMCLLGALDKAAADLRSWQRAALATCNPTTQWRRPLH